MPDWERFVRERLGPLGLAPSREREILAELAEHLEDEAQGSSPSNAGKPMQARNATDWNQLGREIRNAEEENMTSTAKTIWMPGMCVVLCAAVLLMTLTRLVPPTAWIEGNGPALLVTFWGVAYLALGALGAWMSRRAGGDARARFFAGTLPTLFHLVVFVLPIIAAQFGNVRFPEHRQLNWLVGAGTVWVLLPGLVLAIGTLPFLRDGSRAAASR